MDPSKTAVVLVEYQNDFTSEGGALHGAVQESMDSTGMLKNTQIAVAAARAAGFPPANPAERTTAAPAVRRHP